MNSSLLRTKCRLGLLILFICCITVSASFGQTPTPTPLPGFALQLTTNRGCLENGDNPVYLIGEPITVSFRIGSATALSANATIVDVLANGFVNVLAFGFVSTNQTHAFSALVGPPTGVEHLTLRASRTGYMTTQLTCSFVVASFVPPGPTRTRTPTRTPTFGTPVPTFTPGSNLTGSITTNRGCIETGDNPVFAVGDLITVSYRINSPTLAFAVAAIRDILPNGFVNIFSFGFVQTNVTYQFRGRIAPPTGVEILQLRGAPNFGPGMTLDQCSFTVVGFPSFPTRTRTPTRTPTATATPSATATPTSVVPCVGACSQPGVVTINDLLQVIQIANGSAFLSVCPAADANGDGEVMLDEVLQAVNNAIHGCP